MDENQMNVPKQGLTRREALKRGAVVAGALWAVPVVQAVGMRPAYAKMPSPGCGRYCIKWEPGGPLTGEPMCDTGHGHYYPWSGSWSNLGGNKKTPPGNCMECPADDYAMNERPADSVLDKIKIYGDANVGFFITYPETWQLADLDDSNGGVAAAKCGANDDPNGCRELKTGTVEVPGCEDGYHGFWLAKCPNGHAISHVELVLDICP